MGMTHQTCVLENGVQKRSEEMGGRQGDQLETEEYWKRIMTALCLLHLFDDGRKVLE